MKQEGRLLDDFRLGPDGVQVCRNALTPETVEALLEGISKVTEGDSVRPHGVRSIADRCERVGALADDAVVRGIVDAAIPEPWQLVRSIFFDKVPGANWHVGWHQDLSIAIRGRPAKEPAGYRGWTEKEGVPHVQAPAGLLGRMVTLRIHLDDAGPENGPLRVIPGSQESRLDSDQVCGWIDSGTTAECVVRAGDILAMRPMLLHASHKAESPKHRRVIHLEFGPVGGLPSGLEWAAG